MLSWKVLVPEGCLLNAGIGLIEYAAVIRNGKGLACDGKVSR